MLPLINQAGNLRVVPREDLLERFISTLREQAQLAAEADEHLLILIFGHGDPKSCGVLVGGKGSREKAPILNVNNVERLLPKNASVTLVMTSCYSGGWLVHPDITNRRGELVNTTGIAAAGPEEESRSWPLSRSIGRACGSIAATAILQSLIDIEEATPEEEEVQEHPTYIELAYSIFETLKKLDHFGEDQQIHFASQDDEWEMEYRRRLGLPLASYKDRWESLRQIPASGNQDLGDGPISGTGTLRKRRRVEFLARVYFASYPGSDQWAANVALHHRLRQTLGNTDKFDADGIDTLYNSITYRLSAMRDADEVRRNMGLQFSSIFEFSVDKWKLDESARVRAGKPDRKELYSRVLRLLLAKGVTVGPVGADLFYTKPWYYLGIALIESGMDWNEIQSKVAMAASGMSEKVPLQVWSLTAGAEKRAWYQSIYRAWRGRQVVEDKDVMSHRKAFMHAMKDLGRKVKEAVK
jgi:hypothetical protein